MPDDAFARIVNADLRNRLDPERAGWLRTRALIPFWLRELHAIEQKIQAQIAERRQRLTGRDDVGTPEYIEAKRELDAWRGPVTRVQRSITERMLEARALAAHYGIHPDETVFLDNMAKISALLDAGNFEAARRAARAWLEVTASRTGG